MELTEFKVKCKVCKKKMKVDGLHFPAHCPNCGECWHKRESYSFLNTKDKKE